MAGILSAIQFLVLVAIGPQEEPREPVPTNRELPAPACASPREECERFTNEDPWPGLPHSAAGSHK